MGSHLHHTHLIGALQRSIKIVAELNAA